MSRVALLALSCLAVACASGSSGTGAGAAAATTRQGDLITQAEIDSTLGLTSALDAVQRLRPRFLRNSGARSVRATESGPIVRVDNEMVGGVEALRSIGLNEIGEIRYYSAVDATARFGGITNRPLIHVIRRTRAR
ncbi:MAG: hypothetical protein IPK85_23230 [Gemmatimonadetes bacterium]|nr:hypothetical protein [Gemmatimonadota bacterium]